MSSTRSKSRNRQPHVATGPKYGAATSKWEWLSAGIGLVLVLGTLGHIVYTAMTTEPFVPAVTIDHIGTEPTSENYVVRFRARNSGPSTAASLAISGELLDGSTVIEASEIVLDYLPPHGERLGGLIFRNDPARYQLRLEAKGYVEP